jgi:chromosome partitioning protein
MLVATTGSISSCSFMAENARVKPRGLSERAALDSLQEEKLAILDQTLGDLADFAKLSFSGFVPVSGRIWEQATSLIEELVGKGAIPNSRKGRKAA